MKKPTLYLFVLITLIFASGNLFAQSDPFAEPAPKKEKLSKQKEVLVDRPGNITEQPKSHFRGTDPHISINSNNGLKFKKVKKAKLSPCGPVFSGGCIFGAGFTDFAVEEIQNLANGCEDNLGVGWSQYYGLGPAILEPNIQYIFQMGSGYYNQFVNIWIDFNDDLLFATDEMIIQDFVMADPNTLYDVPITIPFTATPGDHIMRTMAVWSGAFTDPCGSYNYGEAEDYYVSIDPGDYGTLSGTVTQNTGGAPIQGALIALGSLTTTSADDGSYSIQDIILVGDWTVNCTAEGHNPASETVTITVGNNTVQDFPMTSPTMDIDPLSVSHTIEPNTQGSETINISNNGDGVLFWTAQIEMISDATDDMFDVIFDVPVGVGGGEAGIETDGNYIYTTKWNGTGEFYRYQMDGTYIETINVPGGAGCRDMAYDGNYFYGGAASTIIFELDLANATMISTFMGPAACRAIAYNDNEDVFYCNNWSDVIVKFDKSGANLGSFAVGASGASYYGFAYDGYSGGNPCLWGYSQTGATQNELIQMELPSGNETGLTFDVGSVINVGPGIAGGLAIDNNFNFAGHAFLGTSQNENIWALELVPTCCIWMTIDPTAGALNPGNTDDVTVYFDATGLQVGTVKTADIHFTPDPDVGIITVPVTMLVDIAGGFGYVNGNVFLDGIAPYNIGDVSEAFVEVGPYTGYPDANGNYSIEAYPGTYDVSATLYGYQAQIETGVVVPVNYGNVTQNFTMPCLYGEVSGMVLDINGGLPIENATVEIVGTDFETTTASDGIYSIIVEAGTYSVHVQSAGFSPQTATNVVVPVQGNVIVDFVLDSIDGIILVIDLDPTPNPQITDVIQGFYPGGLVEYTTTIDGYPLTEVVERVFLLLGIFSNNYVLTEADAAIITNWIDSYDNRMLYMEGGDTWAYDTPTALHSYFNINGIADGSADLANVYGINSYWSGFNWSYTGENNWIDHLDAIPPAINVCENFDIGYYNVVAHDAGTYKTVGASFEVTGLVDGNGSFETGIQTIMVFFGYPVFFYGSLEGYLTDCLTGDPIENAEVSLGGFNSVITGSDGYFFFEMVLVGTYELNYSGDGYCPNYSGETVIIEEDMLTTVDICLAPAQFEVDPDTIIIELEPNSTTTEQITIDNPGGCNIGWNASVNLSGDNTEDMFEVIMDVPVAVGGGEAGIETDGNFIYTTKWNGTGEFYRYQMNGTYIETIMVPGGGGCRDMAYDGNYFYGGAASTTIYEMDLANATMISTFMGPAACRAIAYNENEDVFYCNNWSDNITKFDKAGTNLGSFPVGVSGASYYGMAFDGFSPGSPYLWGYSQTGQTQNELIQIELPTGNETGLTFDVGSVTNVGAGIAGGMAIFGHVISGFHAFLGTSQNENIWALKLAECGDIWMTVEPSSGFLAAGNSEIMDIYFDATDLVPGIYNGSINFSTSPDAGSPTVDVTLNVQGLIPPTNLTVDYNCTDITLFWEMPSGSNPDSWNVYVNGELIGNVPTLNYTDSLLFPGIDYCYEITAVYGGEESMPTPELCINVPTPEDLEPVNATAVFIGSYDVLVSWEAPIACLAPDYYNIYRDGELIGSSTTLDYVDPWSPSSWYVYYITAVYYFGESGPSNPAYIVGIDEYSNESLFVYPNPIDSWFVIRSDIQLISLEIYDNLGTAILKQELSGTEALIDMSGNSPGIYFLKIAVDDGMVLRKVVVK